ncbi:FCD domain-containing protein [Paraburkholderia sp. BL6665CI2N2]|uniref:FCD domain-containing protein n=1 Tax=Paraburkholderia sp. BL6665CI2N2 TaxID=1938806 RepID=UPI0010662750|nr:FCD domain-containing protein [Paraburkholderia sp. BL6665CI2N2]TDY23448.1 FCD domain-containing protein [Paraburkholderia sp. BL6665CI2N2]
MAFLGRDPFSGSQKAVFRRRRRRSSSALTVPEIVKQKILPWVTLVLGGLVVIAGTTAMFKSIYRPNGLTINTILVPKTLSDRGLSSTAVSERLRDSIEKIAEDASYKLQQPPGELPDITVPGTSISIQKFVELASTWFPDEWHRSISGEIVTNDQASTSFTVTLRLNGKSLSRATINESNLNGELDRVMREFSIKVMEEINLYLAATALIMDNKFDQAEDRVDEILSVYPPNSPKVRAAWNLKGYIAEHRGELSSAIKYYRTANTSTSLTNLAGILEKECQSDISRCDELQLRNIYSEAIALNKNSAHAHYVFGIYLYNLGLKMSVPDDTHNIVLVHVMHGLYNLVQKSIEETYSTFEKRDADLSHLMEQHRHIYDAIERHDPIAARNALVTHLGFIRENASR